VLRHAAKSLQFAPPAYLMTLVPLKELAMALRFVTLDPGHFHAALVQKEMYPDVQPTAHVYAPLGGDLLAHLQRIAGFNSRADKPTAWQLEVHAAPDWLERFTREKPGHIAVLAGRNARKIDCLEAAVRAGLHVLSDKPWILVPEHLPRLERLLDDADRQGLIAYDIMTERYEVTSILQRELVQDPAIIGEPLPGTPDEPGVYMESVHFLKKLVAGAPLKRPAWFFDVHQQGEALSDVGTHLVDLMTWILFPEQPISAADWRIDAAKRWPTTLDRNQFQAVTGEADFPAFLQQQLSGGALPYFCNTQVAYRLRGVHVKLDVLWGYEAEAGAGDTHLAIFRGSRASVEIHQGKSENYRPELFVVPAKGSDPQVAEALHKKVQALQRQWPGVAVSRVLGGDKERLHVAIPETHRVGHEAHFAEVTHQFLKYVGKQTSLPAWERPNMLAKYGVTTQGVAVARTSRS
jgi:predicted dehydrogenase